MIIYHYYSTYTVFTSFVSKNDFVLAYFSQIQIRVEQTHKNTQEHCYLWLFITIFLHAQFLLHLYLKTILSLHISHKYIFDSNEHTKIHKNTSIFEGKKRGDEERRRPGGSILSYFCSRKIALSCASRICCYYCY